MGILSYNHLKLILRSHDAEGGVGGEVGLGVFYFVVK